MKKPRKKYRPGPVHCNALSIVLNKVRKLDSEDVAIQRAVLSHALAQFGAGNDCAKYWSRLADAVNMADTLASLGICSGAEAQAVIDAGAQALAAVHTRSESRRTWAMDAAETEALKWLIALHCRQLDECSYGEFERAYNATIARIGQAYAGNASPGSVVIVGDVSTCEAEACAASAATSP